jgi:hypothetical protein
MNEEIKKVIAITRPDGGLSICYPVEQDRANPQLTKEDLFQKALLNSKKIGSVTIIDITDIPYDRKLREAWKLENNKIMECPVKARKIIRNLRDMKLENLDNKAFKESRKPNGDIASINNKAQLLRDIPQRSDFETCSIETLKLIIDEIEGI